MKSKTRRAKVHKVGRNEIDSLTNLLVDKQNIYRTNIWKQCTDKLFWVKSKIYHHQQKKNRKPQTNEYWIVVLWFHRFGDTMSVTAEIKSNNSTAKTNLNKKYLLDISLNERLVHAIRSWIKHFSCSFSTSNDNSHPFISQRK